jgi:hypothetical protein
MICDPKMAGVGLMQPGGANYPMSIGFLRACTGVLFS